MSRRKGHSMMVDVVASSGPVVVLQARGRINVLSADVFEFEVRRAAAGADRDVILDASQVTYISSAGLRAVLRLWQNFKGKQRTLHVCSLQPHILQVFEMIGFDQIIPIEPDVAAALAAAERPNP